MIINPDKVPFSAIKMQREEAELLQRRVDELTFEGKTEEQSDNMRILEECRMWWDSLYDFRRRRRRNRAYHRGDQWSDRIEDPKNPGTWISEDQYIRDQGKVPLKQNIIRQMMKNLVGQYRASSNKSIVLSRTKGGQEGARMLSNAMMHVQDLNYLQELDARALEEFALSGCIVQKELYKYFKIRGEEDVKIKMPNMNRVFFNTDIEDVRGEDFRIVGEIVDAPLDDIIATFAKTPQEEERIKKLYSMTDKQQFLDYTGLESSRLDSLNFYMPEDSSKARLIEVWRLESRWRTRVHDYADGSLEVTNLSMEEIQVINDQRVAFGEANGVPPENIPLVDGESFKEQYWKAKFLTPHGHTLWEGESPFDHGEHPFTFVVHPLIDGEVWGFVEDIIDQQRYINRMIILLDFIMSSAAKGVLMVPEDSIPDHLTPEDFAEEWRSFDGVITYKPSRMHQKVPEQISSNSTAVGLTDMLKYQMQFINDISGIHGAIQGKEAKSGTPSSLYAQEAEHSSTNTKDFFMSFNFFRQKRDEKILKLILQYYTEERYFAIDSDSEDTAQLFDPTKLEGHLYDLKVVQGNDTPVFRELLNQSLMKLVEMQMIDAETYLEHSPIPYSKAILETLKERKAEMQQGQVPNGQAPMPGENPESQQMIQQAVAGTR